MLVQDGTRQRQSGLLMYSVGVALELCGSGCRTIE